MLHYNIKEKELKNKINSISSEKYIDISNSFQKSFKWVYKILIFTISISMCIAIFVSFISSTYTIYNVIIFTAAVIIEIFGFIRMYKYFNCICSKYNMSLIKYSIGHFLGLLLCTIPIVSIIGAIILLISSIVKFITYLKILDENKEY